MDRTFPDNPSRPTLPTREKKKAIVPSVDLEEIKENFNLCVLDIKERFSFVDLFSSSTSTGDERNASKDILRFQTVSIDSLLDYCIHQIVVYGLKKMFNQEWNKTPKYKDIPVQLNIDTIEDAIQNPESTEWIEKVVVQVKKGATLMSGKSICNALELIGINLDSVVEIEESKDIEELRKKLDQLYERRTSIVHYADMDYAHHKKDITKEEVERYINLVDMLCNRIFELMSRKNSELDG